MKEIEVLSKCQLNEMSPIEAYDELFIQPQQRQLKRAHFIKLFVVIKGKPLITMFLALLFALPIPVGIAKMFMRRRLDKKIDESFPITFRELFNEYVVKHIMINIHAKDEAIIKIKTM